MSKTQMERDRRIIADVKFFATMQHQQLGERLLRSYLRDIRDGKMRFGRAPEVTR